MSIFLLLGLAVSLVAALFDWRRGTIPDGLTRPVIVASPFLHAGLSFAGGAPIAHGLMRGGWSVAGIVTSAVVPLVLWKKGWLGGGDVKLFAGLGGLLLPRWGIELELCVFAAAALSVPARWAYEGRLFQVIGAALARPFSALRPASARRPLEPALAAWFRLGPCFVAGLCFQIVLHWRAP